MTDDVVTTAIERGAVLRRRAEIRTFAIDDEAVLYDVAHDSLHYLNATARVIWDGIDGTRMMDELVDELRSCEAFVGADCPVDDVAAAVSRLVEDGLVDRVDRAGA